MLDQMLSNNKKVLIIGIHGVGQMNLAQILCNMGHNVTGADVKSAQDSFTSESIKKLNIRVYYLNNFDDFPDDFDFDLVIYSSHGGEQNPLVRLAHKKAVPVLSQGHFIAKLLALKANSIAICGTNGKTTTTSFMAQLLNNLSSNVSYYVGSSAIGPLPSSKWDSGDDFVFEADEYAIDPPANKNSKLSLYQPSSIVCTNLDFDHPDIFTNNKAMQDTFFDFFKKSKNKIFPKLFLNGDDKNLNFYSSTQQEIYRFGFEKHNDLQIYNFIQHVKGSSLDICIDDENYTLELPFWGRGNIYNVCACILYLVKNNFDLRSIIQSCQKLHLPKRRMEIITHNSQGGILIDDYAHHPLSIQNLTSSLHAIFPTKKIHLIFEPHTYSRTQSLMLEFIQAFVSADFAYILPIYPSREKEEDFPTVRNNFSVMIENQSPKLQTTTPELLIESLAKNYSPHDIIVLTGAGNLSGILKNIKLHFF